MLDFFPLCLECGVKIYPFTCSKHKYGSNIQSQVLLSFRCLMKINDIITANLFEFVKLCPVVHFPERKTGGKSYSLWNAYGVGT